MNQISFAISLTFFALGAMPAFAQQPAPPAVPQQMARPVNLEVHPLRGGVYWVSGGVSNSGFIIGDKNVVVFDAERTPEAAQKMLVEIAKLTPKPVNAIVISHADPDHVGGIPAYPQGTQVIAQENAKSEMQVSANDPTGSPANTATYQTLLKYLPTRTIGSTETVTIDGVRMVLMYTAPAHTSGDLVAYLPAQKIVFTGDIITTNLGRFPVIHLGGSSLGWIACMKALLALDADTYIPGHGPIESKSQLQNRLRDAEERREQIKAMVNDNKSLADIERALPEPDASPMFASFTQTVYAELTKGYPPASPPWYNLIHK